MGAMSNMSVYGLMIIPLAAMVKGHSISLRSHIKLSCVMTVVQLAQSTIATAVPPDMVVAQLCVQGVLLPLITVAFCFFVLTDAKAAKVMRLQDCGDGDPGAVVATMWCLCYTVLFRWFPWYHSMTSRGFEAANLAAGAEAYLTLVTMLSMCRSFTTGHVAAAAAAWALHVLGAIAGATSGMPVAGTAVTAALMTAASAMAFRAPADRRRNKLE
ncbi:hypothetical protein LSCM1_07935 [Leishmania martiniquensis]|uniref:Uncharacterized protein n=1 Tax=Leishmania martiniquensis TaxID=1580590 RepID=A0A836KUZ2_9TRYP|nr:hypothetical protein LSCM1_07935 [Leishmania martiniquensis]